MLSDRFSPVFVFEIRRMVRSRIVMVLFCAYLALQIIAASVFFSNQYAMGLRPGIDLAPGKDFTTLLLFTLYHFNAFVVIAVSFVNTVRQGLSDDTLTRTPLSAVKLLLGKIEMNFALSLLFYSATLPMLALAWQLRGIELLPVLASMSVVFLVTQALATFVCAAVFGCRETGAVLGCVFALLILFPGVLTLFEICCHSAILIEDSRELTFVLLAGMFALLGCVSLFVVSMEMVKTMARNPVPFARFCVVLYAMGVAFLVTLFSGALITIPLLFVLHLFF